MNEYDKNVMNSNITQIKFFYEDFVKNCNNFLYFNIHKVNWSNTDNKEADVMKTLSDYRQNADSVDRVGKMFQDVHNIMEVIKEMEDFFKLNEEEEKGNE